ncbi:hypothetical protein [Sandarakinorhabdus sp.]|uniref:hypothetical protein n=1 Tax=Sandarakinorhabdus sp. TaxID=1916663 RepID=UPI00286E327B|nr:hypothetical protein [Sandarakinorhabdus sp.]
MPFEPLKLNITSPGHYQMAADMQTALADVPREDLGEVVARIIQVHRLCLRDGIVNGLMLAAVTHSEEPLPRRVIDRCRRAAVVTQTQTIARIIAELAL